MLNWVAPFNIFSFLDNCHYQLSPHRYECLLAAGAVEYCEGDDLLSLDRFLNKKQWAFGHLSYELKNSIHQFSPGKQDPHSFPPFFFFQPMVLVRLIGDEMIIDADDPDAVYSAILSTEPGKGAERPAIEVTAVLSREGYIERIAALKQHILRGDCYEINFCTPFFSENTSIDPLQLFLDLVAVSPVPFAAFYKLHHRYLISASPERFLARQDGLLISQPMKGTVPRSTDAIEDERLKKSLQQSAKDRSENVMIVDLVRNDLTPVSKDGTVKVDELFGVYTYPQVHQMISTVSGELREGMFMSDILRATFPMGSMTGAPKHRVMQLIDQYEPMARGIFSGSVGYVEPGGNFDFSVVIRSLMYQSASGYLSYQVGSAITFNSLPEDEWEECMVKAAAIKKVLTSGQHFNKKMTD